MPLLQHRPAQGSFHRPHGEAEQPAAVETAAPAGPVTGWLVVLDGPAKGRDLRLGAGRSFLGLDADGTPVTLSADAPLSARRAVLVYDEEKSAFTLLPGSSQELCYLGGDAVLTPSRSSAASRCAWAVQR